MGDERMSMETEVVVVGSGPGGATVARQLSRAGRRVGLLERGQDHRKRFYYGTYLGRSREIPNRGCHASIGWRSYLKQPRIFLPAHAYTLHESVISNQ
jgi:choline dehydrogenase-like flavoprotein